MSHSKTKQPGDVLDYDVDLAKWFKNIPTDSISSVSVSVSSPTEETPALQLGPSPHSTYELVGSPPLAFKVWCGAGTNNTDYKLTCLVTTVENRIKEVELRIKVRDR